ncbi:XK-related protein 5a isoform X2 [Oncorhynchus keta]|uniref:XK-related protein 5a isoform X2 n=1 Tax=Oncorhynchus keta TaxID=8018 RepID=UPI0015F8E74A|nr:XK-related protein 5a isoform X2 [Oncorhynchus keta]
MINAGPVDRVMPSAARSGCWIAWCQAILFGVSGLVILAERTSLIYCIGFYLWNEETQWAGLTLALLLPGILVQVLSLRWYHDDGEDHYWFLTLTHVLQLGIFQRLWDCMVSVWDMQGTAGELGAAVMQQADVSALRLLEALVLTLPQTLLQTYVLAVTDVELDSPVAACAGLCLLSLSWALVLFSRACCLIRPGHLAMPPAALLCQLLWRAGMLGARVASLMSFARYFHWWTCGVAGFHWLTASFWLVAQQPDICTGPWRWRLFNAVLGLVHIFLFLNVKEGPSRFRMAGFYLAMLLENATLLVAASDFLSEKSWDSITLPTIVLCSFLLGTTSLVLYYCFLHPKSTEITQGKGQRLGTHNHHMGSTCLEGLERGETSYSLGGGGGVKSLPQAAPSSLHNHGSFSLSGVAGSLLEHPGSCGPRLGNSCPCRHHHWLLIRLALKTGDLGKINCAYGSGGVAAVLEVDESYCNSEAKSTGGGGSTTAGGGSCDRVSGVSGTSVSESQGMKGGLVPLSDCKEEFQSASDEPTSAETPSEGEEESKDSLEDMESPLESPVSDSFKRSSPEGKLLFGKSPEPYFCPNTTLSSTTLYFSADPQSPSSTSNPHLDRVSPPMGMAGRSFIPSNPAHRDMTGLQMGRMGPCYTSTPKLDSGAQGDSPPSIPHLSGPRRQLILSRRDQDDGF